MSTVLALKIRMWTFEGTTGTGGEVVGVGAVTNRVITHYNAVDNSSTNLSVVTDVPFYWEIKNDETTNFLRWMFARPDGDTADLLTKIAATTADNFLDPYSRLRPGQSWNMPWKGVEQQIPTDTDIVQEMAAMAVLGVTPAGVAVDVAYSGVCFTWVVT